MHNGETHVEVWRTAEGLWGYRVVRAASIFETGYRNTEKAALQRSAGALYALAAGPPASPEGM